MKIKKVLIGLIILSALSWTSKDEKKQNGASDVIIKSWMLQGFDSKEAEANMSEKEKTEFKKVVNEMVTMAKTKTIYAFDKNGKITTTTIANNGGWKKEQGTWSIPGDGKMLSITINGIEDKLKIIRLTDNNLDLYSAEVKMTMKFVSKK
ncbi:MAG: lipocalin family protein [Flavobacterium sp. JAD_PAG50586_2]|nr:MAG: lipocalin family protein [Flavobacterium sp. JAD_PAG50586_2]